MNRRTFFSSLFAGAATLPTLVKAAVESSERADFIAALRASPIDYDSRHQWIIPSLEEILPRSAYGPIYPDIGRVLLS